MSTTISASKRF